MKYITVASGKVRVTKLREFEQTIQLIFDHLPPGYVSNNLTIDVYTQDLYHVFIVWDSESSLERFKSGKEYQLLIGAFAMMDSPGKMYDAKWMNIQLLETNNN